MAKNRYLVKWDDLTIKPSDENNIWEADWTIWFQKDEQIGTVSFAGEKGQGVIPIKVELVKRFRDRGYGTKVFKMMVDWAFNYSNIYEVTAVFDRENDRCKNALQKSGFVYRESDGNMDLYSITKQRTVWTGVYAVVGVIIGLILGIVIGNPWAGLVLSLLVCLSTGIGMDANAEKARESVTGKRHKDEQKWKQNRNKKDKS